MCFRVLTGPGPMHALCSTFNLAFDFGLRWRLFRFLRSLSLLGLSTRNLVRRLRPTCLLLARGCGACAAGTAAETVQFLDSLINLLMSSKQGGQEH